MTCACDNPVCCGCKTMRANSVRSDVEHAIRDLLTDPNLAVTGIDGLSENKIGLLRELRALHEHMNLHQGAALISVASTRCADPCQYHCHEDDCCHCHPTELHTHAEFSSCPECQSKRT